jgi:SNF2 family DNA or RNA helicase
MRFGRSQAALLDAMLDALPDARADEAFAQTRSELRRFQGALPLDPPAGFTGELRPYQRAGLGWLDALRRLGLGGILADDMGLGKTVQLLALLEMRREAEAGPSLVVVPRSIVFNWQREAARFTPRMRVLVHHGPGRGERLQHIREHDLVLTTYATLRADAADFTDVEFDCVVLDEAQAIKNAGTATAKAARLLRARHRLAMSGTPIENHLGELWSLFEFLNPGMLGASAAFQRAIRASGGLGDADAEGADDDVSVQSDDERSEPAASRAAHHERSAHELVARAVRPFVLRRTKQQVAPELPERIEQTVWVELSPTERRLYDELRDHYRATLLGRIDREGIDRSRMHVLEALLRLRQAACHPGLVDAGRKEEGSAKLDVLFDRLAESREEGHKALVFSQFTSMLALVRARLDQEGVAYEYLDGQTRDREARVDRFQRDPSVSLFLVSLKAGGLGLNLTAADSVFLLDPWWNPAAEAQAIDRAHRIGQTRRVLAVRLVARDTVEEKVVELQRAKRELADAIIRADDGLGARLTREELETLLG